MDGGNWKITFLETCKNTFRKKNKIKEQNYFWYFKYQICTQSNKINYTDLKQIQSRVYVFNSFPHLFSKEKKKLFP